MIAVLVLIVAWALVACAVAWVIGGGIRIADRLEPAEQPVRGEAAA